MSIQKWHVGKLIILWSWGGVIAALALTDFTTRPVNSAPGLHLIELLIVLIILVALSAVSWHWLGGKESDSTECENSRSTSSNDDAVD
ncbi:hypothetical protein H7849_08290 [Alloacidobacterium dinghuense]|uniref:Uncharacterized protein n=1 Tax=Alloacidobacterium dinghuense TaxID=2763107 RepID=A0A7G8BMX2_9BACT|nr:hypothetical protein [Alloacidobacterium dinghuense]QNI33892.1 hypothetical protein H7849_08290 [Alloacidobacterium dinghuense]